MKLTEPSVRPRVSWRELALRRPVLVGAPLAAVVTWAVLSLG